MAASGGDGREWYTPIATSVIAIATARAVRCGDDSIRTEDLLQALISVPAIKRLLGDAGVNVVEVARELDLAYAERGVRIAASIVQPVFRAAAHTPSRSVDFTPEARETMVRSFQHAEVGGRVDAFALLLSELDRERDARDGWLAAIWKRLRGVPAPRDTWLLSNGASWMSVVMPVLRARDVHGESADEQFPALEGEGAEVILHNDDKTTFEFVVDVLQRELECSEVHASWIAVTVDRTGEAAIARLAPDAARMMAERIESAAREAGFPLRVSVRRPADVLGGDGDGIGS